MKLKLTAKPWSGEITPLLTANFIEMGYGLQVECMSAQLFFNRSFEPFFAYREINKSWFDLYEDENVPEKGYEKDWSRFDWYHSGYEHNAWFAFPGTAGKQLIADESTFVIENSPLADVHIGYQPSEYHGRYGMQVTNDSDAPGGLAQDGKYLFADVPVTFTGAVRAEKTVLEAVSLCLYREGTVQQPVCCVKPTVTFEEETGFVRLQAELCVPEEGRYTFVLLIPAHSTVLCDDFSLLPADRIGVWKKTAVELGRYVHPSVMRYPGGCFASFYDWHEGIGTRRKPDYSYFWGGYNYNDIGTDEFGQLVEALGCQTMICVNMYHPYKRFYDYVPPEYRDRSPSDPTIPGVAHGRDLTKFANREEGIRQAADWVEYCNGAPDTKWGAVRAANGHTQPYGFRYWEMDNEVHRWFSGEEYAETVVRYSRAMKAVDPDIKIGMVTYCFPLETLDKMLEIAGADIDFFADRGSSEESLLAKLQLMRKTNQRFGRTGEKAIRYCNTEWLPLNRADVYNMVPRDGDTTKSYLFSKWSYALDAASMLMMWQRYGQEIMFINFNNFANTHSQSVIETAKEGGYVTAAGMMLHRFAYTQAALPLQCEGYHPGRNDDVQVQISYNGDKTALVVNLLNRSNTDYCGQEAIELNLTAVAGSFVPESGIRLQADSQISMNTMHQQQICEEPVECPAVENGILRLPAPRLSFAEYVLKIADC